MARFPGNKNYGKQELTLLLTVLEDQLPICSAEWTTVAAEYAIRKETTWGDRTVSSLRRKFSKLAAPSGSGSYPLLQALARRVKTLVDKRYVVLGKQGRVQRLCGQQRQSLGAPENGRYQNAAQADHQPPPSPPLVLQDQPTETAASASGDQAQSISYNQDAADDVLVPVQARNEPTQDEGRIAEDNSSQGRLVYAEPPVLAQQERPNEASGSTPSSLMQLYHEIIQLAVKAQLDSDRREVERELREREERQGVLQRQQKMMQLIVALIKSKPS